MPILLLSGLAQILCVIHIIRTGRNQLWLWAVVLLPFLGCIAYFVAEILPGLMGSREANAVKVAAVKRIDPERELRGAREQLEVAATSANQIRVGDALVALGRHREAIAYYDQALSGLPVADRRTQYKLALALLESGNAARALEVAVGLPSLDETDGERAEVLRARALEALGRKEEAMALYRDLADRVPGEEVRCRHAGLLLEAGRAGEARMLLEEVAFRAKRLTRRQRADQRAMYDWAAAELAKLR